MNEQEEIQTRRYGHTDRMAWNAFVQSSKNGVFLFNRDYMDYHSNRFTDHSLLFFDSEDKIVGLLPANIIDSTLVSHGGLTFGGVLSGFEMTTALMLDIFRSLRECMGMYSIEKLIYKAIPHIYHKVPSDEDLYSLTRNSASLIRRDVASAISMGNRDNVRFWRLRRRSIKKGIEAGLKVVESSDYDSFMSLESQVLEARHNTKPVHSAAEMSHLASKFPDRIKLFTVLNRDEELLAGAIVFVHEQLVHVQYSANSDEGRVIGAADLMYDRLINDIFSQKRYFDFGISTEQDGNYLNSGLSMYKESLGGRAVAYDFYELKPI